MLKKMLLSILFFSASAQVLAHELPSIPAGGLHNVLHSLPYAVAAIVIFMLLKKLWVKK